MPCCSEKMALFGGAIGTCSACFLSTAQHLSVSSVTAGRHGNLISAWGSNIYKPLSLLMLSVKHGEKSFWWKRGKSIKVSVSKATSDCREIPVFISRIKKQAELFRDSCLVKEQHRCNKDCIVHKETKWMYCEKCKMKRAIDWRLTNSKTKILQL